MNTAPINALVFNLLEAEVSLYPANADGTPILGAPLWLGAPAEGLSARGHWLREESRPSGARHPIHHPLIDTYTVALDRVWIEDATQAPFLPGPGQYVLDIVWTDEDTGAWARKTFYGVTISGQGWDARDIAQGFTEQQSFDAQYYAASHGSGSVPALSADLPYRVVYVSATETLMLYSYDAVARTFTAQASTAGRATLGYTFNAFNLQFAGAGTPVLSTASADTVLLTVHGGLSRGGRVSAVLPRLDFYYGASRLLSVSPGGVYAVDFVEAPISSVPAGAVAFLGFGGAVAAVAAGGGLAAVNFAVG